MRNWDVVVALLSGSGWLLKVNIGSGGEGRVLKERFLSLDCSFSTINLKPFNRAEAIKFMTLCNINETWQDSLCHLTNWNPLLLSQASNATSIADVEARLWLFTLSIIQALIQTCTSHEISLCVKNSYTLQKWGKQFQILKW